MSAGTAPLSNPLERLLSELQFELWIGDTAGIRTKRVRKLKTDRQDAQLILQLMLENRFRQIWVPSWENRDRLTMFLSVIGWINSDFTHTQAPSSFDDYSALSYILP